MAVWLRWRWRLLAAVGSALVAGAFFVQQRAQTLIVVSAALVAAIGGWLGAWVLREARRELRHVRRRRGRGRAGQQTRNADRSFVRMLHPSQKIVSFVDRPQRLELIQWCNNPDGPPLGLLTAPCGAGKTRLVHEVATTMEQAGWRVVSVGPNGEDYWTAYLRVLDPAEQLLLIVDDAEARNPAALAALIAEVRRQQQPRPAPKVLFLARCATDWWTYLHEAASATDKALVASLIRRSRAIALPAVVEDRTPAQLFAAAAVDFARHLDREVPTRLPVSFEGDPPLLRLHTAALLTVLGDQPGGIDDMIDGLLRHESRYWRLRAEQTTPPLIGSEPDLDEPSNKVLKQLVVVAALLGAKDRAQAESLVARTLGATHDAEADRWTAWLMDLYPGVEQSSDPDLGTLQPDLFAERLAAEVLEALPEPELVAILQGVDRAQAVHALTVLGRATIHSPSAESAITAVLAADPYTMIGVAIGLAGQFAGVYGPRLVTLIQSTDLSTDELEELYGLIPYPSLELSTVGLALTTRLAEDSAAAVPAERKARWVAWHAIQLARTGQCGPALLVSEQAVTLYRELASANRDSYLPQLAAEINNHVVLLAEAGRHGQALPHSEEAIVLLRELALADRDVHLRDLATSLAKHAALLVEVGWVADSLPISEEAVALYRELVASNRHAYLPGLATSIHDRSLRLIEAGRREDALGPSEEALALRRELVAADRYTHLPQLAASMDSHAALLVQAGRRADVLELSTEAVGVHRELVAGHRDAHLSGLAKWLHSRALLLAGTGRHEEALSFADEAIAQRRELVAGERNAHLADLAASVHNRASLLAALGRREEALSSSEEAVALRRELVAADQDAHLPDLAASVNNHALRLVEVGRREEALTHSEESVTIYTQLAERLPDTFNIRLLHALQPLTSIRASARSEVSGRVGPGRGQTARLVFIGTVVTAVLALATIATILAGR